MSEAKSAIRIFIFALLVLGLLQGQNAMSANTGDHDYIGGMTRSAADVKSPLFGSRFGLMREIRDVPQGPQLFKVENPAPLKQLGISVNKGEIIKVFHLQDKKEFIFETKKGKKKTLKYKLLNK